MKISHTANAMRVALTTIEAEFLGGLDSRLQVSLNMKDAKRFIQLRADPIGPCRIYLRTSDATHPFELTIPRLLVQEMNLPLFSSEAIKPTNDKETMYLPRPAAHRPPMTKKKSKQNNPVPQPSINIPSLRQACEALNEAKRACPKEVEFHISEDGFLSINIIISI